MRTLVEHALANAAAATALALAAVLVGLVVRRPAVRNALWVIVLLRLVVPPVWTVSFAVPAAEPVKPPVIASVDVDPIPVASPAPVETVDPIPEAPPVPEPLAASPTPPEAPAPEPLTVSAFTIAGIVWLTGSAFVFLRAARRIARFQRALRDAAPAPVAMHRKVADLARSMGLRTCPEVLLIPGRVSPAVWMVAGRAKLILPAGLLAVLDADQRASVIAHELAHLRRGDPWVRWLELLVSGLYWWFPLVAWFRRELRTAEEECCDLRVVAALGRRRDYATALVETAAFLGNSGPAAALASGAGPVKHLKRRVTMIMRATWPAGLTRLGLATVLGLGGLGLAFGPAVAQERREEPKRERGREEEPKRERPREDRPREEPRRERGDSPEVDKLRAELEHARALAREAMERVRAAEEALAKAEGRPVPPREGGRGERGGPMPPPVERGRAPDPFPRGPGRPDAPPTPPGVPGRGVTPPPVPGPDMRDLQMQIEELRRALERMQVELRKDRGDRKEPATGREGRTPERREEPKRPEPRPGM